MWQHERKVFLDKGRCRNHWAHNPVRQWAGDSFKECTPVDKMGYVGRWGAEKGKRSTVCYAPPEGESSLFSSFA